MTNDYMQRRARALLLCLMGGEKAITSNAMINAIVTAFGDVRTAALEEAAKVADERAEKRAKQVTVAGQAGDYAMESLAIARGSEAESIRDAIRALKPTVVAGKEQSK